VDIVGVVVGGRERVNYVVADDVAWTDAQKIAVKAALEECVNDAAAYPPLPEDVVLSVETTLFAGAASDMVPFGHTQQRRMMFNCFFAVELNYCLHDLLIDEYLEMVRRCMAGAAAAGGGGDSTCTWRTDVLLPPVADLALLTIFDDHQRTNGMEDWGVQASAGGSVLTLAPGIDWERLCKRFAKRLSDSDNQRPFLSTAVTWEPGHWYEVTMDVAKKTCTVNDSFALPRSHQGPGDKYHRVSRRYARFIQIYHEYLKSRVGPLAWQAPAVDEWSVVVDAEYPRQEQRGKLGRQNDCAVFAAQSAKLRCRGVDPKRAVYLQQNNALQMRMSMFGELHSCKMLEDGHLQLADPLVPDNDPGSMEVGDEGANDDDVAFVEHIETLVQDLAEPGRAAAVEPQGQQGQDDQQHARARPEVPDTLVKVPGLDGKCAAVDSLVTMFFDDKKGGKVPADRLSRVMRIALRMAKLGASSATASDDAVAVAGEYLTLFSAIGMCLHDGGVKQTWIGRVQKMWKPVGKSMKDTVDPVPLTDNDSVSGYEVVCTWYRKRYTRQRQARHGSSKEPVYDYPVPDTKRYDMQSFLGLADMAEIIDECGRVTGHVLKDHTATLQRWTRQSKTMWNDMSFSKEDKGKAKFRRQYNKRKVADGNGTAHERPRKRKPPK